MRRMKDSGIAWIGEIPEGWETKKARFLFQQRLTKGSESGVLLASTQNYGIIPQYKIEGAVKVKEGTNLQLFKRVEKNDFVISLRSFQGGIEHSEYDGVCSPAYQVFFNTTPLYHHFFKYLFKSHIFISILNNLSLGIRDGKNIQYKDVECLYLPFPPLPEQHRIADYLDAKCAEIDRSMELVRQGIDKLRAYKMSVITEAVTKGLDPDVPMKASGVPWIGEIPVPWKCVPLKRLVTNVKTGSTPKGAEEKYYAENGIKWFTPADFTTFPYLKDSVKKLSDLGEKEVKIFPKDSILLIGIGATMGKVALSRCQCSANQQINCIQCRNDLLPLFLTFYLSTISDYLFKCGKFTTLPILNQEETKNIYIPCPSVPEQHRIAVYLDAKCAEIDTLISQKQTLLDKLAAYKKSLIFECVTGKREVAA